MRLESSFFPLLLTEAIEHHQALKLPPNMSFGARKQMQIFTTQSTNQYSITQLRLQHDCTQIIAENEARKTTHQIAKIPITVFSSSEGVFRLLS